MGSARSTDEHRSAWPKPSARQHGFGRLVESTAQPQGSWPAPADRLLERPLLLAALFCVAYVAVDTATDLLPVAPTDWTPWNPQAALALTLVAFGGPRFVAVVFGAALLSDVVVGTTPAGDSLLSALWTALGYSAAGYAVHRFTGWTRRQQVTLRDLSTLVAIAVVASFGVASLHAVTGLLETAATELPLHAVSLQVVVGEALALIVASPALLLLFSGAWRDEAAIAPARGRLGRDLLLFLLALAVLLLVIFWLRPFDQFRMSYLLFLPMVVIATRQGLFGAALALPLVQAGLIAAVTLFAPRVATAVEYQMLMLAMTMTSMYLGLLASERERAAQRLAMHERELREQRDRLAEAQRSAATAELAAALAHDLNQPLSAIGTYGRAARLIAERDDGDRATLLRALDQICSESARAGQQVRRMRDFFRTGSMQSEAVTVDTLLERGHAHLRDRLERAAIQFDVSVDPDVPPLRTDAVQVGAVLDNLIGNACDALAAAPPPRRIRVTAAQLAGRSPPVVRISVQDNGPGIAPELRSQLFRPLATSKPHGMGLGLALSRSITERLGGGLSFDAAASITTFHLDLPADECRPN